MPVPCKRVGCVPHAQKMSIHVGDFLHALPVGPFAHLLIPLGGMVALVGVLFVARMWFVLRKGPA